MARYVVLLGLLVLGGCFSMPSREGEKTALVTNNPFGVEAPPSAKTKASYTPASAELSERVDTVGKKVLKANPQIGLQPLFATIYSESAEIFHVENRVIYVTKGVVDKCKTEPELAAVLAIELGKMVSEREARTSAEIRNPEQRPPIQVPMGNGVQGSGSDFTTVAELGKFEMNNPKSSHIPVRLDPNKLAGGYLEKAGFQVTDLDSVRLVLQEADKNIALERGMKGMTPQSPWKQ
jgi:hypothetical protein